MTMTWRVPRGAGATGVANARAYQQLKRENQGLRVLRHARPGMIGTSAAPPGEIALLTRVAQQRDRAAARRKPARARISPRGTCTCSPSRKEHPFIGINCAAR
ncbi:MAG: hypothetical protein H6816_10675 [Phycisphaerales bacterium]|nr:hypothetical protein [Phycisphaerales bacterium]